MPEQHLEEALGSIGIAVLLQENMSVVPCSSTARQSQYRFPPMRTAISSRCQMRPGRASRLRNSVSNCAPNLAAPQRTVS